MFKPNFKKAFDREKFFLQSFGAYPLVDPRVYFSRFRYFIIYSINVINVALMWMLLVVNDIKNFLDACHFIVISLTLFCKLAMFVLAKRIKFIEDYINSIDVTNIPIGIIRHVRREEEGRNWIYFPQRYLVLGTVLYLFLSCSLRQNDRSLVLISWSPFDLQDIKYYYLTICFQSVTFLTNGLTNGSIDSLYYILIDIACCQMDILMYNLINLDNSKGEVELCRNLKRHIMNHMLIVRFVKNVQNIYSTMIFIQCIGSVLVICILGFQLSVTVSFPSERFFIQTIFFNSMIFQIFCYTWFGQKLMFKSEEVVKACYLSKWNEFELKNQKSILILMTRCTKPIILTAGIFDLTLKTFTKILKTSYSYMAALRIMFNEYVTKN